MAPRGRSRSGKTRMDAAIHAMKQFGFDDKVVAAKMRDLLKEYDGQYGFIEDDAYSVLLEALLDQNNENQVATHGEASNANEIVEGDMVEEGHPIVPTDGFVDIPIGSSDPIAAISSPPLQLAASSPSMPVGDAALALPPPPPPPAVNAALQLPPPPPLPDAARPLPPATPLTYATSPPPGFGHRYRRKPCHGWVTDGDEEPEFIRLPSSLDGNISPPKTPPSKPARGEFTVGRSYRPRLRSRWDLKPEDE